MENFALDEVLVGALITAVITLIIFKCWDRFVSWDRMEQAVEKLKAQKKIYQELLNSGSKITRNELLRDIRYDAKVYSIIDTYFNDPARQLYDQAAQSITSGLKERIAALNEICSNF